MRGRRKFPRNSSRKKVRPAHSVSRACSATCRDSCSVVVDAFASVIFVVLPEICDRSASVLALIASSRKRRECPHWAEPLVVGTPAGSARALLRVATVQHLRVSLVKEDACT